jgi:hypothetical protein
MAVEGVTDRILLNDILRLGQEALRKTKIRFMIKNPGNNPIRDYLNNPEIVATNWFGHKYKKKELFKLNEVGIGFFRIGRDRWLLVTIKEIDEICGIKNGLNYRGKPVREYEKYFGRLVVSYHNKATSLVRRAEPIINEISVVEILDSEYQGDEFPGYEGVILSWGDLARVIEKREWVTALKNQKGIYVITDKSNGKHYVGSATGGEMLLQRFRNYVDNGHGGNKELKVLGKNYIEENFQYSILENYNESSSDEMILNRESWWKQALLSKIEGQGGHGYNAS